MKLKKCAERIPIENDLNEIGNRPVRLCLYFVRSQSNQGAPRMTLCLYRGISNKLIKLRKTSIKFNLAYEFPLETSRT